MSVTVGTSAHAVLRASRRVTVTGPRTSVTQPYTLALTRSMEMFRLAPLCFLFFVFQGTAALHAGHPPSGSTAFESHLWR